MAPDFGDGFQRTGDLGAVRRKIVVEQGARVVERLLEYRLLASQQGKARGLQLKGAEHFPFYLKKAVDRSGWSMDEIDFGIAQFPEGTMTDSMLGTPKYMAPEQILGKKVDETTDAAGGSASDVTAEQ